MINKSKISKKLGIFFIVISLIIGSYSRVYAIDAINDAAQTCELTKLFVTDSLKDENASKLNEISKTGDNSNIEASIILTLVTAAAMFFVHIKEKVS